MEQEGILQAGFSTVEIDIDKQRAYLRENGVDVESMSEDEIKKGRNRVTRLFRKHLSIFSTQLRILQSKLRFKEGNDYGKGHGQR